MAKKLLDVTVRRKRWYRGQSSGSRLRRADGKMCCLGFACRASRIPARVLINKCYPEDLGAKCPPWATNSTLMDVAAEINDNIDLTDRQRECELKPLGRKFGVRFTFVD